MAICPSILIAACPSVSPPLKQQEFELIAGWLAQGARGPTETEQQELTTPKDADAAEIVKWETFLNNAAPKYAMTARYLYEHLFLAHIKFGTETRLPSDQLSQVPDQLTRWTQ